jgi:hypothetical protein
MLSVANKPFMLSVIMLGVSMLNVVIPNVVAAPITTSAHLSFQISVIFGIFEKKKTLFSK